MRKIIHLDCDCYYAALEERDFPELRGRPVAVGGTGPRGVLSTCNYPARTFGVRSAMPTRQALHLCPGLIVQRGRFEVYRKTSEHIRAIMARYCDRIEPLSLDEAFLDVSDSRFAQGSATRLAQQLRQDIRREVGITVSAGVAPNKYLAKIASDWQKPDGLFVLPPDRVADFVMQLPVDRLFGVGAKTAERLHSLGYQTCGDLQRASLAQLLDRFGRFGPRLYQLARGEDDRPVKTEHVRKSLSVEHTYDQDLPNVEQCLAYLDSLIAELRQRLEVRCDAASVDKVFLKMRFNDFSQTTIERSLDLTYGSYRALMREAWARRKRPVRLLGVGVRFRDAAHLKQMTLFDPASPPDQPSMTENPIHQSAVQGVQALP